MMTLVSSLNAVHRCLRLCIKSCRVSALKCKRKNDLLLEENNGDTMAKVLPSNAIQALFRLFIEVCRVTIFRFKKHKRVMGTMNKRDTFTLFSTLNRERIPHGILICSTDCSPWVLFDVTKIKSAPTV